MSEALAFDWTPFYEELADQLVAYRNRQTDLIQVLEDLRSQGCKITPLEDRGEEESKFLLKEIDPFTFFGTFNRGITTEARIQILKKLKKEFKISAVVPSGFTGVPILNAQKSWFFSFRYLRKPDDVDRLWEVFIKALDSNSMQETTFENAFDRALEVRNTYINLTMGLFWIRPRRYISLDSKMQEYLKVQLPDSGLNFQFYKTTLERVLGEFDSDLPHLSHEAHLARREATHKMLKWERASSSSFDLVVSNSEDLDRTGIAELFDAFMKSECKPQPGFSKFLRDDFAAWVRNPSTNLVSASYVSLSNWFLTDHKALLASARAEKARVLWNRLFACEPQERLSSPTPSQNHIVIPERFEKWWNEQERLQRLEVGKKLEPVERPNARYVVSDGERRYWWLNANPKIWDFAETPVGGRQTYTSHNERGNKRVRYKYFQDARPGDLIVGYVTSPDREIVAICRITKGLGSHEAESSEAIEFEKIEQLVNPVPFQELQKIPALKDSEPLINNQGSLFRLTPEEYATIRSLIDELNPPVGPTPRLFTKKEALESLFLGEDQLDHVVAALKEKKNVILQGAPGVGKTFIAKRLAYALIGAVDQVRVQMIQFHQSYSYEDFIQGFRPSEAGHFELKNGHFFQFCRRAQRDPENRPHVYIIDEINRGNLSKIFGEVMMLIEPDKRGKDFAVPLAYSSSADETFFVPDNLYFIGMMNTADRSLAMVDYALRRRFRFITLKPEFGSPRFQEYLRGRGATGVLIQKIVDRMNELNGKISADQKNLGPGYRIGHSYFCPLDSTKLDEKWYASVIMSEIKPLLEEYWLDDEERVASQIAALLA